MDWTRSTFVLALGALLLATPGALAASVAEGSATSTVSAGQNVNINPNDALSAVALGAGGPGGLAAITSGSTTLATGNTVSQSVRLDPNDVLGAIALGGTYGRYYGAPFAMPPLTWGSFMTPLTWGSGFGGTIVRGGYGYPLGPYAGALYAGGAMQPPNAIQPPYSTSAYQPYAGGIYANGGLYAGSGSLPPPNATAPLAPPAPPAPPAAPPTPPAPPTPQMPAQSAAPPQQSVAPPQQSTAPPDQGTAPPAPSTAPMPQGYPPGYTSGGWAYGFPNGGWGRPAAPGGWLAGPPPGYAYPGGGYAMTGSAYAPSPGYASPYSTSWLTGYRSYVPSYPAGILTPRSIGNAVVFAVDPNAARALLTSMNATSYPGLVVLANAPNAAAVVADTYHVSGSAARPGGGTQLRLANGLTLLMVTTTDDAIARLMAPR